MKQFDLDSLLLFCEFHLHMLQSGQYVNGRLKTNTRDARQTNDNDNKNKKTRIELKTLASSPYNH